MALDRANVNCSGRAARNTPDRLNLGAAEPARRGTRDVARRDCRAGRVHIISNVGSFGRNGFKIGMPGRLQPMKRVRELGDASAPLLFDVHAVVYVEDAPVLEEVFHQHSKDSSVSLVDTRTEFFHLEFAALATLAKQRGLAMAFTRIGEAASTASHADVPGAGHGPTAVPTTSGDRAPRRGAPQRRRLALELRPRSSG